MRRSNLTPPSVHRPIFPFVVGDEPAGIVFLSGSSWFAVRGEPVRGRYEPLRSAARSADDDADDGHDDQQS